MLSLELFGLFTCNDPFEYVYLCGRKEKRAFLLNNTYCSGRILLETMLHTDHLTVSEAE